MNSFYDGMMYLINGFRLISRPGVRRFVIIPLIINILFFIALFFSMHYLMNEFNQWIDTYLPKWLHWLNIFLWLLFFISFFLFFIVAFVTVANLISAPFNGLLAEKIELYLTGHLASPRSLLQNIKDFPRVIGRQMAIAGYYLLSASLIFILFFIPIIQLAAGILWLIFHAWFLALTYIDYPTDNHHIPLKIVRNNLKQKPFLVLGFGGSVLFVSMIPVLNFFIIPAAVAGATQCWLEAFKHQK